MGQMKFASFLQVIPDAAAYEINLYIVGPFYVLRSLQHLNVKRVS